jgi:hypothetical protein
MAKPDEGTSDAVADGRRRMAVAPGLADGPQERLSLVGRREHELDVQQGRFLSV